MRKLRLEDIQVESYETQAVPAHWGTVKANDAIEAFGTDAGTHCASCPATCQEASCRFTLCGESECYVTVCGPTDCGFSCFTDIEYCCGAPA